MVTVFPHSLSIHANARICLHQSMGTPKDQEEMRNLPGDVCPKWTNIYRETDPPKNESPDAVQLTGGFSTRCELQIRIAGRSSFEPILLCG